jgi:uroporphyrinogen-III decarboxylase
MISYHLCGGLMPLLDIVKLNGADALETMTPPDMGGDCDIYKAAEKVGDKLAFIGGLDQNKFFENGNSETITKEVQRLFLSKPEGGYICSPSDHFFFGKKENIKVFSRACKECRY